MDYLEIECQKTIGGSCFTFFYPVAMGNFSVCCWTQQRNAEERGTNYHNNSRAVADLPDSNPRVLSSSDSVSQITGHAPSSKSLEDLICCGICLYEDGRSVDPTHDRRFRNHRWVKDIQYKWHNHNFGKRELGSVLNHIAQTVGGLAY